MSASGRYRRPKLNIIAHNLYGQERRRQDPISLLARSLYEICREATDSYELAAQLEALGFNRYRVKQEYGLSSPFELAEVLFQRTPRKPDLAHQGFLKLSPTWLRQITILAGIFVAVGLQAQTSSANWLAVMWLMTWSIVGSKLISKTPEELDALESKRVLSALLLAGFLGLGFVWLLIRPAPSDMVAGTMWWGLAGSLWIEQLIRYFRLRSLLIVLTAVLGLLPYPTFLTLILVFASCLFLFYPQLAWPRLTSWRWFGKHAALLFWASLYGLSAAYLFVVVFQHYTSQLFWGGMVLILVLFLGEWFLLWLQQRLSQSLWLAKSSEDYQQRAWRLSNVAPRLLIIMMFLLLLAALQFSGIVQVVMMSQFMMLGLCLSLALILLSLDNLSLPAGMLLIAALLLIISMPLGWVLTGLALALAMAVLLQIGNIEHYGVHIL